ncbi:MAG: hypothetical protein WDA07_12540 [Leucobacter sp.]
MKRAVDRMNRPLLQEPKFIQANEGKQNRPRSLRPVTKQLDKRVVRAIALTHKVPVAKVLELAEEFGVIATRDSKLPQSTFDKILDRLNAQPEPTAPTQHPEAAAAEQRAEVIRRDEPDWAKYGFSDQTKEYWVAAGVPVHKAHIAAMCRESLRHRDTNVRINPQTLRTRLEGNQTVLETLLSGQNYVRVLERIAGRKQVELQGIDSELLWQCTSQSRDHELDQLVKERLETLRATTLHTKSVPFFADIIAEISRAKRPELEARALFQRQIDEYFESGEVSDQLTAYGRAFGVHDVDEHFDQLLRAPRAQNVASPANLEALKVAEAASKSENFFYVDPSATQVLAMLTAEPGFDDEIMLPRSGFAILESVEDSEIADFRQPSVLMWDGLETWNSARVVFAPLRKLFTSSLNLEVAESHSIDRPRTFGFRLLTSLNASRPRVTGGIEGDSTFDFTRSSSRSSTPGPGRSEGEVTVTYVAAFGEAINWSGSGGNQARNQPEHRWQVKGHFRMQWYPSEKTHKRIYIEQHTSGPADRPLIETRNVKVFRSR